MSKGNSMSKDGAQPRPELEGFCTYMDWVDMAARLLSDFVQHEDEEWQRQTMMSFAATITAAGEFAFKEIYGHAAWISYQSTPAFRCWLGEREPALGQFESIAVSWRHTRLRSHVPTITHTSATTGEVTTIATLENLVTLQDVMKSIIVTDMEVSQMVDPPTVRVEYIGQKIFGAEGTTLFYPAAQRALAFWRAFDPSLGPAQAK